MKLLIVSGIYTTLSFGLSILLWPFLSAPLILEAKPLFLIHPIFTVEFSLMLSILILWIIVLLVSQRSLKQKLLRGSFVIHHFPFILLVPMTLVVAISGCLTFTRIPVLVGQVQIGNLTLPGIPPPNPFGLLYGLGILVCEIFWTALLVFKYFNR